MNDLAELERRYRRLLACYPPAFRREHEEEMLVVLLACARNGRRRAGALDTANLLWNALRLRLAPPTPRPAPSVVWGVRLIVVTACLELVALVVVVVSRGAVDTAVTHIAGGTAVHWTAVVRDQVAPVEYGAPIAAAVWLVLAFSNVRGRRWARGGMVALSMLTALSLLTSIAHHAATYAPADLIAGSVLCATAVVATALIISSSSDSHYSHHDHARSPDPPGANAAMTINSHATATSWN